MPKFGSPFLNILPSLDVHGFTRETVYVPVSDFINDNKNIVYAKANKIYRNVTKIKIQFFNKFLVISNY